MAIPQWREVRGWKKHRNSWINWDGLVVRFVATHFCCSHIWKKNIYIYIYCIYIYIWTGYIHIPQTCLLRCHISMTCWGDRVECESLREVPWFTVRIIRWWACQAPRCLCCSPRCIWRASTGTVIAMPGTRHQQQAPSGCRNTSDQQQNREKKELQHQQQQNEKNNVINNNNSILVWA